MEVIMDRLEEFIRNNSHQFNDEPMPLGHEERFRQKLERRAKRIRSQRWLIASSVAAIALLLTFALVISYQPYDVCYFNLSDQLVEINQGYQFQVNRKQQSINRLLAQYQELPAEDIRMALNELNFSNEKMLEELCDVMYEEQAQFTISRHYQVQLEILEGILSTLENELDRINE